LRESTTADIGIPRRGDDWIGYGNFELTGAVMLGYEPTREAAMAAFAKSWRREPEDTVRHTNTSRRASRDADDCEGD
jgi:hypothetical protein